MAAPSTNTVRYAAFALGLTMASGAGGAGAPDSPRCLFVSSYHQGYAWSDGVERGLRSVLDGQCELRQFDMDTKRNKEPAYIEQRGRDAKLLIETWRPDVVITADDNAARHLIVPYYRDDPLPFVFCGVNWTADEYGFPFDNVTGMVEVAPIEPMLRHARSVSGGSRAFYLGARTFTERKNLQRFEAAAAELGMTLDSRLVPSTDEWIAAFRDAQAFDFVILGSKSGINDWDPERVTQAQLADSRRLVVTNHGWMMPYAMFGLTKVPEEHGEWAAKTALAILDGTRPGEIPIVANRKWDMWANEQLLTAAGLSLPSALTLKAKRVATPSALTLKAKRVATP